MTIKDAHIQNRPHVALLHQPKPGNKALRRARVSMPNRVYFVTSTTVERQKFFANFKAGCAAARCFEDKVILGDAEMLAWILMPDHGHWLIQLGKRCSLDWIMNRIKSSSARMANHALKRQGKLWNAAYHDHAVRKEKDLRGIARYMVANPLRAKLVECIHDYPFWNAIWV